MKNAKTIPFAEAIPLPAWVLQALTLLEAEGHEAWCVGGAVRDHLLGRSAKDYDIATSASCQNVQQLFEDNGFVVHTTGIKHGTVTVVVAGNALEITTYRTDWGYSDGRHPDKVIFVQSIEEDLSRRDFTINALAYHSQRGLFDPFGGQGDLQRGCIRCVGDPEIRFKEDALRILRGCRFAAQLGFSFDEATLQSMVSNKMALHRIAAERITNEVQGMLTGDFVGQALMQTFDVLCAVMPELTAMKDFQQHTPYHIYDVWEHTAHVVQNTPPYPLVRWAALLHDTGKPGAFFMEGDRGHFYGHAKLSVLLGKSVLSRMCYSQAFVADVLKLVRIHDDVIQPAPRPVKRALVRLDGNVELFRALCELKRADALSQAPRCAPRIALAEDLLNTLEDILESDAALSLKDLSIDGNDILEMGVPAGPQVGELLQRALDAVIDEQEPNDREALLALVRRSLGSAAVPS